MLKRFALLSALLATTACAPSGSAVDGRKNPAVRNIPVMQDADRTLKSWWSFYNDATLDRFVAAALNLNANAASGKQPQNHKVDLINDVVGNYFEYRYLQNQTQLLKTYIQDRQDFLSDIEDNYQLNDTDTARFNHLLAELKALLKQKAAFETQEKAITGRLTERTKLLPEYVSEVLDSHASLPESDITLILASPASVMASAPKIVQARSAFTRSVPQNVDFSQTASVFPDMTFSSFFGISDDVFLDQETMWTVSVGTAAQNLRMDQFDKFRSDQAYVQFQNNLSQSVSEIESLIVSYGHIQEQYITLRNSAEEKEDIMSMADHDDYDSFAARVDELEQQDALYRAHLATLRAEYERAKILIDLYKMLGVY